VPRVLDSNVLGAANGLADHVGATCVIAAIQELEDARTDLILLDDLGQIMAEYRSKTRRKGQPGPADFFVRWLLQVAADRRHLRTVAVSPLERGGYAEYPGDSELRSFDSDDQIYVAVAVASDVRPAIVNATDSDWAAIAAFLLRRHRIRVRTIC
jgi:hypothetical protein